MPSTNTGKEGAVSAAVESLRKAMAESDKASLEKWLQQQDDRSARRARTSGERKGCIWIGQSFGASESI